MNNLNKKNIKMKTRIVLSLVFSIVMISGLFAQQETSVENKDKDIEVVEIQTSAICGMCKKKLEHDIAFEKGVKFVELDDETKILTVKYKKGKNSKEKIKKAITKAGYDADEMIANPKAYAALPDCCKKDVAPH